MEGDFNSSGHGGSRVIAESVAVLGPGSGDRLERRIDDAAYKDSSWDGVLRATPASLARRGPVPVGVSRNGPTAMARFHDHYVM